MTKIEYGLSYQILMTETQQKSYTMCLRYDIRNRSLVILNNNGRNTTENVHDDDLQLVYHISY